MFFRSVFGELVRFPSVCLSVANGCFVDPYSRAEKKNISHGSEALPQITTDLIQKTTNNKKQVTDEEVRSKIQQAV